jgi:hypothetical protein
MILQPDDAFYPIAGLLADGFGITADHRGQVFAAFAQLKGIIDSRRYEGYDGFTHIFDSVMHAGAKSINEGSGTVEGLDKALPHFGFQFISCNHGAFLYSSRSTATGLLVMCDTLAFVTQRVKINNQINHSSQFGKVLNFENSAWLVDF